MNKNQKRSILISLGLLTILIIIISSGLSGLLFKSGMPFPKLSRSEPGIPQTQTGDPDIMDVKIGMNTEIVLEIFSIMITIAVVFIVIKKLKKNDLKSMIESIGFSILIIGFIVFFYLSMKSHNLTKSIQKPVPSITIQQQTSPVGKAPGSLLWVTGIVIAGVSFAFAFRLLFRKKADETLPEKIENESIKARESIIRGENLRDVIIRYYEQMCAFLQEDQDIEREIFTTVREFEKNLADMGIPENAIRNLSRLFETARYSNLDLPPESDQITLNSFDSIIDYFKAEQEEENSEII